jgi:hypothetical protein
MSNYEFGLAEYKKIFNRLGGSGRNKQNTTSPQSPLAPARLHLVGTQCLVYTQIIFPLPKKQQ